MYADEIKGRINEERNCRWELSVISLFLGEKGSAIPTDLCC